jgi:hypothetical protein
VPRGRTKASGTSGTDSGRPLRFPAFITLALTVTVCSRCTGKPVVYAAVIDGLERRLDPLPLSLEGLRAAAAGGRFVAVVRPWGPPLANRAGVGHWWVTGIGEAFTPTLLADHVHDAAPLSYDPALAAELLPRFIPPERHPATDPDAPPPF